MKLAIAMVLLSCSAPVWAASDAAMNSASGQWKITGDVRGRPVDMMCQLTQTAQKLGGTCSSATDGFVAHKVDGSVKGQKFQLHFQSALGSSSIMLIVNGKVNEDASRVAGDLDVEPMGVSGKFEGERTSDASVLSAQAAPSGAGQPTPTQSAPLPASSATDPSGTWRLDGDFGGMVVHLNCVVAQKEKALSGTCKGEEGPPMPIKGQTTDQGVTFSYDSQYDGQPIHVTITAKLSADGANMSGKMSVEPFGVDADLSGTKQPASAAPSAGTPPAP